MYMKQEGSWKYKVEELAVVLSCLLGTRWYSLFMKSISPHPTLFLTYLFQNTWPHRFPDHSDCAQYGRNAWLPNEEMYLSQHSAGFICDKLWAKRNRRREFPRINAIDNIVTEHTHTNPLNILPAISPIHQNASGFYFSTVQEHLCTIGKNSSRISRKFSHKRCRPNPSLEVSRWSELDTRTPRHKTQTLHTFEDL